MRRTDSLALRAASRARLADIGVAELLLGLALELGLGELDGDDGGDALAHVLTGDLVVALDDVVLLAVGVDDAGERGLEAGLVHAALGGVDVVCEGDEGLLIAVVVLQGELRDGLALRAGEVDHVLVHGGLVLVEVAHILADAALVAEDIALLLPLALVADVDGETGVQKGLLAHAGVQHVVVVDDLVEHLGVGLEAHGGAVAVGLAEHMDGLDDLAAGELHAVALSLLVDLDLEPPTRSAR